LSVRLYFEAHAAPWSEHAPEIGTSAIEVAALVDKTASARAALADQFAAQQAAMAATLRLHLAMAEMKEAGSAIIKKIRAKAAADGEGVYFLASIPAPARPSPLPPPGKPTNFTFTLRETGTLLLRWACPNPRGSQGTVYQVSRRVGDDGTFEFIGVSGLRRFVDNTLPAGAASVTYQIVAIRSTTLGLPGQFIINLGVNAKSPPAVSVQTTRRAA
jgi:hypothetical protein